MLYVSRRVGNNKFAICDTDDYMEQIVDYSGILEAVRLGVEIAGVETYYGERRRGVLELCIKGVSVYQNNAYVSPKQIKTKVLRGVDIKTSGSMITSVTFDDNEVGSNNVIRLSDYGTSCADNIFQWSGHPHQTSITVIVDDKVKLRTNTFKWAFGSSMIFDVREMTNTRFVGWIYREIIINGYSRDMTQYIIDDPKRQECYRALGVVVQDYNPLHLKFSTEARDFVEKSLLKDFEKLCAAPLKYITGRNAISKLRAILKDIWDARGYWLTVNKDDYSNVRSYDNLNVFTILSEGTTIGWQVPSRIRNFFHHLTPSDQYKRLYVDLCYKVYPWLYSLREELENASYQ